MSVFWINSLTYFIFPVIIGTVVLLLEMLKCKDEISIGKAGIRIVILLLLYGLSTVILNGQDNEISCIYRVSVNGTMADIPYTKYWPYFLTITMLFITGFFNMSHKIRRVKK